MQSRNRTWPWIIAILVALVVGSFLPTDTWIKSWFATDVNDACSAYMNPKVEDTTDAKAWTTDDAKAYLTNSKRSKCFSVLTASGGAVIAHALQSGKLGKVVRKAENGGNVETGYVGPGYIQTTEKVPARFAAVYWDGGSIDTKDHPVTQVSINHASGSKSTEVSILDPTVGDTGYWTLAKAIDDSNVVVDTTNGFPEPGSKTKPKTSDGNEHYTASKADLVRLDRDGIRQFIADVQSIDKGWNK